MQWERHRSRPAQRFMGPRGRRSSDAPAYDVTLRDQRLYFREEEDAGRVGKGFSAQGASSLGML
jgi:hypothetical protein